MTTVYVDVHLKKNKKKNTSYEQTYESQGKK